MTDTSTSVERTKRNGGGDVDAKLETLQSIEAKLDKNNDLLLQIVRTLSAIRAIYLGGGGKKL